MIGVGVVDGVLIGWKSGFFAVGSDEDFGCFGDGWYA